MGTSHPTDHSQLKQDAPGPEPAPKKSQKGIRRVVVFVGRPRPQPA